MKCLNGSFWLWCMSWLAMASVAACFRSPNFDFALYQSLSQLSPLLQASFWTFLVIYLHFVLYPLPSSAHLSVSTCDILPHSLNSPDFSYLNWQELLQAKTSTGIEVLTVHLWCKFHLHNIMV